MIIGIRSRDPRHNFANQLKPASCFVLALGVYLACNLTLGDGPLFPGSNQRGRFCRALRNLISRATGSLRSSVIQTTEGKKNDLGTHSIRKGVATYVCSGSTAGPTIVSVCLHCGWTIGNVLQRYFRYESAGDQFCGRVAAGLPLNSVDFALLPPHFPSQNDSGIDYSLSLMFPSLYKIPQLHGVISIALASLVYHIDHLKANLPSNHSIFTTILFRDPSVALDLTAKLIVGHKSSFMIATGIPPHTEMYRGLKEIRN